MANPIQPNATYTPPYSIRKGNVAIGVNPGEYSAIGNFWSGIDCPSGGYVTYINKPSNGPSIFVSPTDADYINLVTGDFGAVGVTNISSALAYVAGLSDRITVTGDYQDVVTNGLVFASDAGFTPSYPKGGTSWYDFSGNEDTAALMNGVGFSSNNGGILTMDGTDDYADVPYRTYLDLPTARTTSFWVKLNSTTRFQTMLGQARTGGFNQRKWDVRYGANSGSDQIIRVVLGQGGPQMSCDSSTTYNLTTQWYNISVAYDGSVTTCTIYVNGVQAGQITNAFSSLYSSVANGDTTLGFNLGRRNDGGNLCVGSFANLLIYNRALTAAEVLQNYNNQKSRFGL